VRLAGHKTATTGAGYPERHGEGNTMYGMAHAPGPAHARRDAEPRDHQWVLVIVAGFALYDVWTAWSQLGSTSGFGRAGWTLTVIVEVYLLYALFAWLGGAAGPRSRRFAMWSAGFVFILSLIGQASSRLNAHRIPPAAVVVFVSVLPVIGLMLIAFLIHFRQMDRAAAAEVAAEDAVAGEAATLRAELEAQHDALSIAQSERDAAQREAAEATAKAEVMTRKLAAVSGRKAPAKKAAVSPRGKAAVSPATQVPKDFDAQAEALTIIAAEPGIKGAQLGPRVGKSERWGQLFMKNLTGSANGNGERNTP
jgi:hypothetical protein